VFSGAKHIIVLKRVRLSWVCIIKITGRALLSSIFTNSCFMDKALKVLEGEGDSDEVIVLV
jgi:hypothetical protein